MIEFYSYPKCTTCRKAKKWLDANEISYTEIHLVDAPPTATKIKEMHEASDVELKKFFNTSGMKYRELGLKDKLPEMSEAEQYELLASDGMLIKRPLSFDGKKVTLGFKEDDYQNNWA
ncbi:arsenate reductase family protein [Planomicrobium sp. YIM 101495]|uniref:arsenate reductase family protein n=1 Tax=Planomicrobium sp. YIM 101495 TaxID=2665160 RepID=UPI0012B97977|nr:arsenate reductase family protein [Planomicrobium sp. YIM 101495]MTD31771.1 Spx/MgsR family RNA polymerase-binding regulatory protein [Planomicrobium sp. YIM 101495]